MTRHVVCKIDEIDDGEVLVVELEGRSIGIFRSGGEFSALINRCPHQGAKLADGKVVSLVRSGLPGQYERSGDRRMVRCPWHGWEFDIKTGQSWCRPERVKTRSFPVEVQSGAELVQGPYVAETVTVEVEGNYVTLML